jgi:hypothetical protein
MLWRTLWKPLERKLYFWTRFMFPNLLYSSTRQARVKKTNSVKATRTDFLLFSFVLRVLPYFKMATVSHIFGPYNDVTQRLRAFPPWGCHYISQNDLPTSTPLVGGDGSAPDWTEVEGLRGSEGGEPRSCGAVSSRVGLVAWGWGTWLGHDPLESAGWHFPNAGNPSFFLRSFSDLGAGRNRTFLWRRGLHIAVWLF